MKKLIIESIMVGIITAILGSLILRLILHFYYKDNKSDYIENIIKKYSDKYIIEITLFLTGMFIHLLIEYFGINNWYCTKECIGNVCHLVCKKRI